MYRTTAPQRVHDMAFCTCLFKDLCLQERYSRKTEAADLQRAFTILDLKGDGKIDAAELGSLFKRLGHKLTKVQYVQYKLGNMA